MFFFFILKVLEIGVYFIPELSRWLSGKESACNAGAADSIPGWEKSPGGRNGSPLQYSCLRNPMGNFILRARLN